MKYPHSVLFDQEPAPGGGGDPPLPPPPAAPDLQQQVAQMQEQIGGLQTALQQRVVAPPPAPPQPTPSAIPGKKELEEAFWKDPLSMTAAIAQRAALEASQMQGAAGHDTLVEMAKQQARGSSEEGQKLFDAYEREIAEMVASMPPQMQTNKTVWQNASHVVFGRHVDDIRKMTSPSAPPNRGGGPLPPSNKQPAPPAKTPLSSDEKEWASRWGLSEDEYRHGKEIYEHQDTAFDSVITFDSAEARRRQRAERERRSAA